MKNNVMVKIVIKCLWLISLLISSSCKNNTNHVIDNYGDLVLNVNKFKINDLNYDQINEHNVIEKLGFKLNIIEYTDYYQKGLSYFQFDENQGLIFVNSMDSNIIFDNPNLKVGYVLSENLLNDTRIVSEISPDEINGVKCSSLEINDLDGNQLRVYFDENKIIGIIFIPFFDENEYDRIMNSGL